MSDVDRYQPTRSGEFVPQGSGRERSEVSVAATLTRNDLMLLVAFILVSLGLYCPLVWRLALGGYFAYNNLAFDFDPADMLGTLTGTPPDFGNVKHPLIVLLRPLAGPLMMAGLSPKEAGPLVMTGFRAASVALCFVFLRKAPIDRPIACVETCILAGDPWTTNCRLEGSADLPYILLRIADLQLADAAGSHQHAGLPRIRVLLSIRDRSAGLAGLLCGWYGGGISPSPLPNYCQGVAAALVINLLFHLGFQFRGSLYIYSAHMHFLIFALGAGLAPWLSAGRSAGRAYIVVVLLLAALVGAKNLPIVGAFVTDFDGVNPPCVAPCADPVGR
jgi:hypothetical protein